MSHSVKLIPILVCVLFMVSCATTPTWKGMSESDIAAWQQLGLDASAAQTFMKVELTPTDISSWHTAGITSQEAILAWHGKGFGSDEAAKWSHEGFEVDQAVRWKKEKFTPEEAGQWKSGDFKLKDAVKYREKGLQPIR